MISALVTLSLAGGAVGGYVILWAYGWSNPWWRPQPGWAPVGRAVMGLGAIIAVDFTYAALRRIFGWPIVPWLSLLIYLLILVVVWYLAWVFTKNRRYYYRRKKRVEGDTPRYDQERAGQDR